MPKNIIILLYRFIFWYSGYREEDLKSCLCIFAILLLFPLGNRHAPSFEQTWIYVIKGWLLPRLVEHRSEVLKKIYKNFVYLTLSSPLEKNAPTFMRTKLNSFLLEIRLVHGFEEENVKMSWIYFRDVGNTSNHQLEKSVAQQI